MADTRHYGITALPDVLAVADNMHRAPETAGPGLRQSADAGAQGLFIRRVELTERELAQDAGKHGVRKFDPKGERFDPTATRRCTKC